jgi:hypothetical protein
MGSIRFDPKEDTMNHIRRIAVMLAGLACALVACAASAPAVFASVSVLPPPVSPGWNKHPPVQIHTVVIGGMPGWQITVIAAGAALLAAATAVLLDRARATRRHITAPTA